MGSNHTPNSGPGPTPGLPRRRFLQWTAAGAAGAAALNGTHAAVAAPAIRTGRNRAPSPEGAARNLIFMVSDGMSFGTLSLADMFRRRHEQRSSHWLALFGREGVRRALFATEAADSLVTDSAAAASCWGCGLRVNNGALNITPDGTQHLPLLVQAAQSGKATGVVTTTRLTHATPAGFIVNIARRDWDGPIAEQMLDRRPDVALGGGTRHFNNELLSAYTNVQVVKDRAELQRAVALEVNAEIRPLLGVFADNHIPFVLDRPETCPTLAEMTSAALKRLAPRTGGFVLQVEGGRVDHAAHSNDAPSLIREQLDFDDAIAEALAFVDGRDDTLLIITSDHGNANPGLTVYGKAAELGFERMANVKHSLEWFGTRLGRISHADRAAFAPKLLSEATGVELNEEEVRILGDCLSAKRVAPFHEQSKFDPALGGLLANYFGVGFVSGNHTADYVEVTAIGPGSDRLAPTGHLTDLHGLSVAALGLAAGELLPDMREKVRIPSAPRPD